MTTTEKRTMQLLDRIADALDAHTQLLTQIRNLLQPTNVVDRPLVRPLTTIAREPRTTTAEASPAATPFADRDRADVERRQRLLRMVRER